MSVGILLEPFVKGRLVFPADAVNQLDDVQKRYGSAARRRELPGGGHGRAVSIGHVHRDDDVAKHAIPPSHHGSRCVTPLFMTNRTRRNAAISFVGSPSTPTRSANRPGLMAPSLASRRSALAASTVAAR